jgi:hypothetical protein
MGLNKETASSFMIISATSTLKYSYFSTARNKAMEANLREYSAGNVAQSG